VTTAVPPTTTPEIYAAIESSYALEPRTEMIKTADAIFAGRVTDISPTQYNQDSGEYWEQTTVEGAGLETTHTALPVFTIELTVDAVWVDEVGLGETAVLTQVGYKPIDVTDPVLNSGETTQSTFTSDWPLQIGDEIIAFIVQREIAWWDGQPVRAIPYEDGFSFEIGQREVLRFANAPLDTYLLRQEDGRYASLPGAYEPWPPLTLNEFSHEIAQYRPVLHDSSVAPQIAAPEPSPATAVPPSESLAPQVICLDPQIDEMVGTLAENKNNTIYTNPVLGVELTSPNKLCIHEPDYLFDSYGFTLSDPAIWEGVLMNVDWLYQISPDQLEAYIQQTIDGFPELAVNRETITVNGFEGVMLWPLPGTDATTQIFLVANERPYRLIFWSAPLDEQAQTLLDGLHFVEPTQSLESLDLPELR
jgi:hypothetical protein